MTPLDRVPQESLFKVELNCLFSLVAIECGSDVEKLDDEHSDAVAGQNARRCGYLAVTPRRQLLHLLLWLVHISLLVNQLFYR